MTNYLFLAERLVYKSLAQPSPRRTKDVREINFFISGRPQEHVGRVSLTL